MATVADMLRSAREARGLSVLQVAELTKIKTEHVRDLDAGNYHSFAAPVYIRGFVRTYATALKLDVPRILAELDAELAQTKEFRAPPSLTGRSKSPLDFLTLQLSRVNWRIAGPILGVLALVGVLVLGIRTLSERSARDPLAGLKPALYQPRTSQSGELLPLPVPGLRTNVPAAVPGPRRGAPAGR